MHRTCSVHSMNKVSCLYFSLVPYRGLFLVFTATFAFLFEGAMLNNERKVEMYMLSSHSCLQ